MNAKSKKPVLHCWHGNTEDLEFGSDEWAEAFVQGRATCLLPAGHDGPHEYTPDSEIVVDLPEK